jgi:hypothetical protein
MVDKISDHEKKMLEMQYLLKENTMYMEDTFKDLENWTSEIKEKEKKVLQDPNYLKNQNKVCSLHDFFFIIFLVECYLNLKGLPPIRALAETKKKRKVKKEKKAGEEVKPKPKKLNSYDYRSWDKIDVVSYFILKN